MSDMVKIVRTSSAVDRLRAYKGGIIVYRPDAVFQLTVEKLAQILVVGQIGVLHLFQVASKNPAVKFKSGRAEPDGQSDTVERAPKS